MEENGTGGIRTERRNNQTERRNSKDSWVVLDARTRSNAAERAARTGK